MSLIVTHPVPACRLWVDGVGCWLICFEEKVVLGNALPLESNNFKVPIMADLNTEHAAIALGQGDFGIEAINQTRLNSDVLKNRQTLKDGDELTLGDDVQLIFQMPSPLSQSARLTIESGHRFNDGINGVILFRKTCQLGAGEHHHIVCRDWESEVVLFARKNRLYCRTSDPTTMQNGQEVRDPFELNDNDQITTDDWSFRVESVKIKAAHQDQSI